VSKKVLSFPILMIEALLAAISLWERLLKFNSFYFNMRHFFCHTCINLGMTSHPVNKFNISNPTTYMALHVSALLGHLRGSTLKGICFTVAVALSII
jgi:hypothetical protein